MSNDYLIRGDAKLIYNFVLDLPLDPIDRLSTTDNISFDGDYFISRYSDHLISGVTEIDVVETGGSTVPLFTIEKENKTTRIP